MPKLRDGWFTVILPVSLFGYYWFTMAKHAGSGVLASFLSFKMRGISVVTKIRNRKKSRLFFCNIQQTALVLICSPCPGFFKTPSLIYVSIDLPHPTYFRPG